MASVLGCRLVANASTSSVRSGAALAEGRLVAPDTSATDSADLRFVIPVEIHGRVFRMMLDHGSTGTLLTDSTIERLGLPHWYAGATRVDTVVKRAGVEMRRDSTANVTIIRNDSIYQYWGDFEPHVLDSLRFARSLQDSLLIADEVAAVTLSPFDGLVGRDLLSQFDLEFDLPGRAVRLYARSDRAGIGSSRELPAGMRAADCVQAAIAHHTGVDTTHLDSTDLAELRAKPGKRLWNEEELKLPLVVNGRSFTGMFDSGSGLTLMNWPAARALGLERTSANVHAIAQGRFNTFSYGLDRSTLAPDTVTNYSVSGLVFRIGARTLAADSVIISDPTFGDYPDGNVQPLILVGLRHFRDYVLVLSYSTQSVCLRRR